MNFNKNDFSDVGTIATAKSAFIYLNYDKPADYILNTNNVSIEASTIQDTIYLEMK